MNSSYANYFPFAFLRQLESTPASVWIQPLMKTSDDPTPLKTDCDICFRWSCIILKINHV